MIVVWNIKMQTLGVHQPLGNSNRQVPLLAGTETVQPGTLYRGERAHEQYPTRDSALKKEIPIDR